MSDTAPADHWPRFRRLMLWTAGIAVLAVAVALLWLRGQGVALGLHFVVALTLGIVLSLLLGAALMGLVFLSARSGADDAVRDLPPGDSGEER